MNRDRFKFRVWDIANCKYFHEHEETIAGIYSDGNIEAWEGKYDAEKNDDVNVIVPQNRLIFEQCTGIRDKNGKLLYEGDIVSFQSRGLFFKGTVVWTQEEVPGEITLGGFGIRLPEDQEYEFMDYSRDRDSLEVVGNIHEDEKR